MTGTLVVTNDFPPRPGGIQVFVHELVRRLPPDEVVVLTSAHRGSAEFDAKAAFPIVRVPYYPMVPTPDVARRARDLVRRHGLTAAWFGAAAPLGLLGATLRRAGVRRVVATTHGHEAAWATLPVARGLLRRIAAGADVTTYLGDYTRARLLRAVGPAPRLERLTPGVDLDAFRPGVDATTVRDRYRLADRPVVVCVSRLVPRKGQDVLMEALPAIRRRVPGTALLVVGSGPDENRLRRLAAAGRLADAVVFTGSVPWAELPAHFAAGDVFAMPCRTRRGGLDVEGLGMVYLEASATGLPVVAGRSGGAPDAVRDGETGFVVDGTDVAQVADRVTTLLLDNTLAGAMGAAGRAWVQDAWRWDVIAARLTGWLAGG